MTTTMTPTAYEENAAEVIRRLKDIASVTNKQIGDYLGLSGAVVQQRVTGTSKWSGGELIVLADFFEVPFDLLLMDPKTASVEAIQKHDVQSLRFRLKHGTSDLGISSSGWMSETPGQTARFDAAA